MTPTFQSICDRVMAVLIRLSPQSSSARHVVNLAGGTAGSQVIVVAATPILTRLYGPESFGVLATFASMLAILNVASSLRYELAIAVPPNEDDAVALVFLCFVLVTASTVAIALGLALVTDELVAWLKQPAIKPLLWLLPIGILLTGIYQALSYWAIRQKQFAKLAQTKMRQSFLGVATNLLAAPLGTIGLLIGQIVSQSAGSFEILRQSPELRLRAAGSLIKKLPKLACDYSHFAIYSTPASLLNSLATSAPLILLSSAFGPSELGQLILAQRLLLLPASIISSSFAQVFLQQSTESYRAKTLAKLFLGSTRTLALVLIPIFASEAILLWTFSAPLFGTDWASIGTLAIVLAPMLIAKTIVGAVGQILFAIGKTNLQLAGQIIFMIISLSPFVILPLVSSQQFLLLVSCWSLASAIAYVAFWGVCFFALIDEHRG